MAKKQIITIVSIIVLALLGSFLLYMMSYEPSINNQNNTQEENNQETQNNTAPSTNTGAPKLSYDQAIKIYAGKRLQFDQNCVVNPTSATFKKGTVIMLDNRASVNRTISLGNLKYSVKAYDFALVTLTTTYPLPHTILVDCGTKQNAATINLQQ